jgi:hypothetical protein
MSPTSAPTNPLGVLEVVDPEVGDPAGGFQARLRLTAITHGSDAAASVRGRGVTVVAAPPTPRACLLTPCSAAQGCGTRCAALASSPVTLLAAPLPPCISRTSTSLATSGSKETRPSCATAGAVHRSFDIAEEMLVPNSRTRHQSHQRTSRQADEYESVRMWKVPAGVAVTDSRQAHNPLPSRHFRSSTRRDYYVILKSQRYGVGTPAQPWST